MKNKFFKRLTALVLATAMLISMSSLTGCSDRQDLSDKDWSISDEDKENVRELTANAVYADGKVTLTLTSDTSCFAENIAANDIYLTEYKTVTSDSSETSDTSEQTDENTSDKDNNDGTDNDRIKKLEVKRNSDTEITVTADTADEAAAYYIAVHKDAVTDGKFAEAVTESESSVNSVDVTLDKSYAISVSDADPVVSIERDALGGLSDVTNVRITLGGVFSDMAVGGASVKDNDIEISLSGKPITDGDGIIYLSDDEKNYTINITVPVLSSVAVADNSSYRLKNGKLYFDISLADDEYSEFTDKTEGNVSVDDKKASSVSVSADKKTITVAFDTDAKDVDTALEQLSGKTVKIAADAVASGVDSGAFIGALNAYVSAYFGEVTLYSGYIDTSIDLYINDGYVGKELTKDSITFDGDLSDNEIKSVEKVTDNHYKLSVKFNLKKNALKNEGYVYGTLNLKDGLLYNSRKTLSDDTSAYLYARIQNGGFIDTDIEDIVDDVKKVLDTAQLFGIPTGPVSFVLETFSKYVVPGDTLTTLASKCLNLAGITSGDKEDSTEKAFIELNNSINRLSEDISYIEKLIQQSDIRMREAFDKQKYISYREAWKSFTNGPMKDMTNIMEEFKSEYTTYLVTFMKNTGYSDSYTGNINNGTLNVYLNDENRGVELPSIGNEKFSLYYSETKLDKFVFAPEHLTSACNEENKGNYTDPVDLILADPAYKTALEKFNKENDLKLTDTEIRSALETQASAYAMSKIDAKKINTVYNNYMEALTEEDLMLGNVMNIYISMLSCYYNFQSEAKENIIDMQNFLTTYTIKATSFASYASWFNSGYDRKANPILTKYQTAMKMLERDYLHDTSSYIYVPNGNMYYLKVYDYYDWSYVANDKVRVIMKSAVEGKLGGNSSNLVQNDVIQLMEKRYNTIKEGGHTEQKTFGDYIVASGAVPNEYKELIDTKKTYFATDILKKDGASYEDGYLCTSAFYPDSYYCELRQTYDISAPFGYKNKANPKYLADAKSQYINAYTLSDTGKVEEVKELSTVGYREGHFWWKRDTYEVYTFEKSYLEDYALFREGDLPVFADHSSGEYSKNAAKLYEHDGNFYQLKGNEYVRTDVPYKDYDALQS